MDRIVLIEPPSDMNQYDDDILGTGFYPPLWALSLATYLRANGFRGPVEILDGQYRNVRSFIEAIDYSNASLVGLSPKTKTYTPSLEIAQRFKREGATVYFGGHHTAPIAEMILANRGHGSGDYCIDGVVCGDGELAFARLAAGDHPGTIGNLVTLSGDEFVRNPVANVDLDALPIADRSLIDIEEYFGRFQKAYPHAEYKRPMITYSQKGCSWRARSGGCIFCGRMDRGVRHRSPKQFIREIEYLVREFETDFLWDISDDFLCDSQWFSLFHSEYSESPVMPRMRIFARAQSISQETTLMLADVGVAEVYIGAESGDDTCLRRMNKGATARMNVEAAELLSHAGIGVHACHVLGAPGENECSLLNTLDQVRALTSLENVEVCGHILEPMPGSRAFHMTLRDEPKKYAGTDNYSKEELERDWVKHHCDVPYERLKEFVDVIEAHNH